MSAYWLMHNKLAKVNIQFMNHHHHWTFLVRLNSKNPGTLHCKFWLANIRSNAFLGRRGTELARKLLTFLCEKCTKNAFFHTKYLKKIPGEEAQPLPIPHHHWGGGHLLIRPYPPRHLWHGLDALRCLAVIPPTVLFLIRPLEPTIHAHVST